MSDHRFRNPQFYQVLGYREAIREWMPNGSAGFVATDLDLVLRWFGPAYGTDAAGKFAFVELKHGSASLGTAQRMTFRLINDALRLADPTASRYVGFYVIKSSTDNWVECDDFCINTVATNQTGLIHWLQHPESIAPMWHEQRDAA